MFIRLLASQNVIRPIRMRNVGAKGPIRSGRERVLSCSGGLAVMVGAHPVSFDASGGVAAGALGEASAPGSEFLGDLQGAGQPMRP